MDYFFNKLRLDKRKFIISVIFGFLGFIINFMSITVYEFQGIKINILLGLLFPIMISLAWGYKYGIVSSFFGGCQTLWFLWVTDGYGIFYSVPIFMLWVIGHGFLSDLQRSQESPKWYYNKYVGELFFRVIILLGFFTLFRWLIAYNPPFWAPQITTRNLSYEYMKVLIIKEFIEGYFILLLADGLLKFNVVVKLFRLPNENEKKGFIIITSFLMSVLIWLIDAILLTYFFDNKSFLDNFVLDIDAHDLFLRMLISVLFIISGLVFSNVFERNNRQKMELEKNYNKINSILNLTSTLSEAENKGTRAFMGDLLHTALEIIPEADYGTAFVCEEGYTLLAESIGHDEMLKGLKIKGFFEKMGVEDIATVKNPKHVLTHNLDDFNKYLIQKYMKPVKESLIMIFSFKEEKSAGLFLDIAKNSNKTFNKESLNMARSLKNVPAAFFTIIRDYQLKQDLHKEIIMATIKILSLHNPYTEEHSMNVAKIALNIAEKLGLNQDDRDIVYWTGLVHDIGKILIPYDILDKAGLLTEDEYEIVKKHSALGYETLNGNENLSPIAEYVLNHHEKWGGGGYPNGKIGEEIPLVSRIIAVADAYDAMTTDRTYRKALSKEKALLELINNSGTQFDPSIVQKFVEEVFITEAM